jgi:hypothetical protein
MEMERLTKRSEDKNSTMVWFVDKESYDMRYEPCEMDSSQRRKVLCKLADYEDAEEQGLLLRLPCPIGSTIWKFEYPTKVDENGDEWTVLDKKRATVAPLKFNLCHLDCIGDLYFLTMEEAEQALAEMQKGN